MIGTQPADDITSPGTNPPLKPDGTTQRPSHNRSAPPTTPSAKPLAMPGS
jgi:hypothetical protein